jgi:hypothetical protein
MITAFVAGVALVAHRTTRDAAATEGFRGDREFRDRVITSALTIGAELLATGEPPRDPYLFVVKTGTPERSSPVFHTLVEIRQLDAGQGQGGPGNGNGQGQGKGQGKGNSQGGGTGPGGAQGREFEIVARPGTAADAARYGPPPASFAPPKKK